MKLLLVILSISLTITIDAQNIVRGPYLQSNTHQSIIIMWRTNVQTNTKVWFGTDSLNLAQSQFIQNSVLDHSIKIENLQPYTKYYYGVGTSSGMLVGGTQQFSFTTHPIPGDAKPTRIWAIGDFGRGNQGQIDVKNSYVNYTGERGTDVWLWLGDNAYQDGTDAEYQSSVFNVNGFSDIFNYVPFYPSPGNHDYNTVWSESTFLGIPYSNIPLANHEGPYFDIVEVPKYAEAGGFPSQHEVFYSYDYGDVHFLSLNSEVFDYALTYNGINQMKAWIESDLQQNTRKFTVAYFHQCPYSKGSHDSDAAFELVIKAMREKIVPLLEAYDVDLVINGHSHVFERSYLMNNHFGVSSTFDPSTMVVDPSNGKFAEGNAYMKDNSSTTPEGTVYIVCGNSGSSENSPSLNHPAMIYTDGGANVYGSLVIDVNRNRLDAKYLKTNGTIGDEFTIFKKDIELQLQPNISVCAGDSLNLQAIFTGGSDSLLIQWIGNTTQTGNTLSLLPTNDEQYTLSVLDLFTQEEKTSVFTITVVDLEIPTIAQTPVGSLEAITPLGSSFTYQWNLDGNPIVGANNQVYQPLVNGNYSVTIIDLNNCFATSEELNYGIVSVLDLTQDQDFKVYPNPAENEITVILDKDFKGSSFQIMDLNGKLIFSGDMKSNVAKIDISGFDSGLYILKVDSDMYSYQTRFSKK